MSVYPHPLTSNGQYRIAGRGTVLVVGPRAWEPLLTVNMTVEVNEKRFLVRGIEDHAVPREPGDSFTIGILIGNADDDSASEGES